MIEKKFCRCVGEIDSCQDALLSPRDLIIAAARGQTRLIKTHLVAGGCPDAAIKGKPSALCYAAMSDNVEMAWLLIKADARLDFQDGIGNTACIYAVLTGSGEVLDLLLSKGAKLKLCNHQGKCPVDYAQCVQGNSILVQQIINNHQKTSNVPDRQVPEPRVH